jgi:hypothetical protein
MTTTATRWKAQSQVNMTRRSCLTAAGDGRGSFSS